MSCDHYCQSDKINTIIYNEIVVTIITNNSCHFVLYQSNDHCKLFNSNSVPTHGIKISWKCNNLIWHLHSMSTAFLLRSQRCSQSSPRNYEVPETLAGPSHQLLTQTETVRPSPDTACRIHGSEAVRFHARSPAGWKRQREIWLKMHIWSQGS